MGALQQFFLIEFIAAWILNAIPLYFIAKKCESEYAWCAFIPIADLFLMLDLAALDAWILILALLPIIRFFFWAYVWGEIAVTMEKPAWLGWLTFFPILDCIIPFIIAFA